MADKTSTKPSLRSQLIGAWELVEYAAHSAEDWDNVTYPMGKDCKGMVMYTPDGYMSASMEKPGQGKFSSDDLNGGTQEELALAAENYLAYNGPFYVKEDGPDGKPVLHHHMTNSMFPNWRGNTQQRFVELSEEGGQRFLTLGPLSPKLVMGELRIGRLKWRRMGNNSNSSL